MTYGEHMAAIESEVNRLGWDSSRKNDEARAYCVRRKGVRAYDADMAHQYDKCGFGLHQVEGFLQYLSSIATKSK